MKKITLLAFVLALLAPLAFARINQIPDISSQALKQEVASQRAALIDISGPVAFKAGHIPGAIDFDAHRHDLNGYLPSDPHRLIIIYCHREACPDYTAAAAAVTDLGYTNVRFYQPGLMGWMAAGGLVQKGE